MSSSSDSDSDEWYDYAGDVLDNNYVMIDEIGSGGFSFVWLAYDVRNKKFVAIKVQHSKYYSEAKDEIRLMRRIREKRSIYLNTLIDNFKHTVNDYKHMCMVFDLMCGSLYDLIKKGKYKKGLPKDTVKLIVEQVKTGLKVLHEDLELIHTDLKPENILFSGINNKWKPIIDKFIELDFDSEYEKNIEEYKNKKQLNNYKFMKKKKVKYELLKKTSDYIINKLDIWDNSSNETSNETSSEKSNKKSNKKLSKKKRKKKNGRIQSIEDNTDDIEMYKNMIVKLSESSESSATDTDPEYCITDEKYILDCKIKISDFGNSCFMNNKPDDEIQTRYYRAPEVILNSPWNESVDYWSLRCIEHELLTGKILFNPSKKGNRDINHLRLIERLDGPLPESLFIQGKRSKYLYP